MGSPPSSGVGVGKRIVFALVPVVLLVVTAEVALRWSGAALRCPTPPYLSGGSWECDPIMDFQMNHNLRFNGDSLNTLGMRGALLDPRARYRIIALGDSTTFGCTSGPEQFLSDPYPHRLQTLADRKAGRGALSILNAGVCGYNSYHGIMLLRSKLRSIPADLILVQYGWNDLLTSTDFSGGNRFREPASSIVRFGEDLLLRTAMYPFAIRVGMELERYGRSLSGAPSATTIPNWEPATEWTPNVPIPAYEHNLSRIVELARGRGAAVWLATSPDAFTMDEYRGREDAFGLTAAKQLWLLRLGGIRSFQDLASIHRRYNDAVRRVGRQLGVPIADMEAEFRAHGSEHLFDDIDAIHPTDAGHAVEAEALYARLEAAEALGRSRADR